MLVKLKVGAEVELEVEVRIDGGLLGVEFPNSSNVEYSTTETFYHEKFKLETKGFKSFLYLLRIYKYL